MNYEELDRGPSLPVSQLIGIICAKPELSIEAKQLLPWKWAGRFQIVPEAVEALYLDEREVSAESVVAELGGQEAPDFILTRLDWLKSRFFVNSGFFRMYVKEVRDERIREKLQQAKQRLEAADASVDAMDLADELRGMLDDALVEYSAQTTKPQTVTEIIEKPDGIIEKMLADPAEAKGDRIPSGLQALDDKLGGGTRPGQLIVLAARPNIGKSVLGFQLAAASSLSDDERCALFFSLEMNEDEVAERALIHGGFVMPDRSRSLVGWAHGHHNRVQEAREAAREFPNLLIETPIKPTIDFIRARCQQVKAKRGLSCVVIDYVSADLLAMPKMGSRYEQVSYATGALKVLARQLQVPLVAITQLNREAEGTTPSLRNLRESGSFEQDADVVLLLHRDRGKNMTELHVAKNRAGSVTTSDQPIPMTFNADRLRFDPEASRFETAVTWQGGSISGWDPSA